MSFLDVDAFQQQGSESIKIGVETGAGKTAWPQSVTYGKKLLGHVDLTFRTVTGELVKSGERLHVEGCDDWGVNLRNVYNIYMKPRGNKTDALPLSEDSNSRSLEGCRPGPNP